MKRRSKIAIALGGFFLSAVLLTGCTANYCTPKDQAHIMYALDTGVTTYYDASNAPEGAVELYGNSNIKVVHEINPARNVNIVEANNSALSAGIAAPTLNFWRALDYTMLEKVILPAAEGKTMASLTIDDMLLKTPKVEGDTTTYEVNTQGMMYNFGYLKFYSDNPEYMENWVIWDKQVTWLSDQIAATTDKKITVGGHELNQGDLPSSDYIRLYKSSLTNAAAQYRSCLATEDGAYGAYGPDAIPVTLEGKGWLDWRGLLEFILVWPIGALIDVITKGFLAAGVASGWAQILTILIVTIIIRSIILLLTFKSTQANAKMTALQPEIQKIQNKYPNSKINQYDQQRMSQEMMALYKKNKVNPMSALITMIIQFPVFICVWGAVQGSALLSTGTFLGLNLSQSISSALFNAEAWTAAGGYGAITALVLFILMSVSQVFSMLIPQWMQKKRAKSAVKLGVNPSANDQNKTMKMFTIVMLVMIIFMGFSLASGLGVYWLVGAIFSVVQTVITQAITDKNKKKAKNKKVVN